jgi:hypothetical protein
MWHSIYKLITNCNQTSFGIPSTFFILLAIAMVIIGPFGIYKGVHDAIVFFNQVKSWPTTPGTISVSGIESHTQADNMTAGKMSSTLYSSNVKFKYNAEGKEYESDQITWGADFRTNDQHLIEKEIADYPLGKKIVVHYDPENPSNCIVNLRYTFKMAVPWIGGIGFIVFGGGFALGMLYFLIKQLAAKGLWP